MNRYTSEAGRLYGVLDRRLAAHEFVAGDYGIADMAIFPWCRLHGRQGQDIEDFPNVKRWFDQVSARPAVARDMDEPTTDVSPRIAELKELAKDSTTEPARDSMYSAVPMGKSGNMTLCTQCKYCSHKFNCHADANGGKGLRAFMYSTGPVFLTDVKNTPKVMEVL